MDRRTFIADGLAAGMAAAIAPAPESVSGQAPTSPPGLAVIAELRFSQGTADRAREALAELGRATRAEPGCLRYVVAQDLDEPHSFHLSELWDDIRALADHFATPHMAAFSAKARALGYSAPFLKQVRVADIADLIPAELKPFRSAPRDKSSK